jgi:hypothetical protein
MANRSYLYSVDSLPTDGQTPRPVRGISEHNSRIPLAHLVLVGRDTTVAQSLIWNARVAVAGDFAGGLDLLTGLLRAMVPDEPPERDWYLTDTQKIIDFLAVEERRGRYFFMEVGELLAPGTPAEEQVRAIVEQQVPEAVAQAEAALADPKGPTMAALRDDFEDHFESFYSDTLYFSFQ